MPAPPSSPPPRRIFVALLPSDVSQLTRQLSAEQISGPAGQLATAVVIDTLRFTTTACQALQIGGQAVHVASTVEQARELASRLTPVPLLCGERHCHVIAGFDLGNSPYEFTSRNVIARDLVFTTTNGTLAIESVCQVPKILLAALVNRAAVCRYLQDHTCGDLLIVCAGTDGQVTWEDVLTAGSLVAPLLSSGEFVSGHDPTLLAHAAWTASTAEVSDSTQLPARLLKELSRGLGGRNLLAAGYHRDLQFAAQLDSLEVVPQNSPQRPHAFTPATSAEY